MGEGYLAYEYITADTPLVLEMKPADSGATADAWAREWGYEGAHDLKDAHDLGPDYDIYRDGKIGKGILRREKGIPVLTYL